MIPFCTKLDTCILDGCVEADHDRVGFGEDITCKGVDIPIVGYYLVVNSNLSSYSTSMDLLHACRRKSGFT